MKGCEFVPRTGRATRPSPISRACWNKPLTARLGKALRESQLQMTDLRNAISGGHYARKQIFSRAWLVAWSHRRRFTMAVELAKKFAGKSVLDFGCGDGTFLALTMMTADAPALGVGAELAAGRGGGLPHPLSRRAAPEIRAGRRARHRRSSWPVRRGVLHGSVRARGRLGTGARSLEDAAGARRQADPQRAGGNRTAAGGEANRAAHRRLAEDRPLSGYDLLHAGRDGEERVCPSHAAHHASGLRAWKRAMPRSQRLQLDGVEHAWNATTSSAGCSPVRFAGWALTSPLRPGSWRAFAHRFSPHPDECAPTGCGVRSS